MTLDQIIARLKERRFSCRRCVAALEECIEALELIAHPPPPPPQATLFDPPPPAPDPKRRLSAPERQVWLDRFLTIYPKRVRVAQAREALTVLRPTVAVMEQIWTALQWQVRQRSWAKEGGDYAPCFDRYITAKRWLDKPPQQYLNESTVNAMLAIEEFVNEVEGCERKTPAGSAKRLNE